MPAGSPGRMVGGCGVDRLPAVDAGWKPALRTRTAGAGLKGGVPSNTSSTEGDVARRLSWTDGGRVRCRPPPGGRCRLEAGAPNAHRGCRPEGRRAQQYLIYGGGRCPQAFLDGWWEGAVSTASRRSMPAGSRRSERAPRVPAWGAAFPAIPHQRRGTLPAGFPVRMVGGCGFDRLSAVDAGWKPALRTRTAGTGLGVSVPGRYPVTERDVAHRRSCADGGRVRFRPPLGGRCRTCGAVSVP